MKILFGLSLICSAFNLAHAAMPERVVRRSGHVYTGTAENGVNVGEPLYSISAQEWDAASDGQPLRVHLESRSPQGQVTSTHDVEYKDGKPAKYVFNRSDTQAHAEVTVTADKIHIEKTNEGKTERADEAQEATPLLLGPDMGRYFRAHLEELKSGKTLHFRMLAVSRMRTFELKAQRVEEPKNGFPEAREGKWIPVKISMTNIFYSALAPRMVS
mgnify:CR=1 FL=1